MVFGLVSSLSKGVMCCASCCIIGRKKYEKVKEVKIMKDKLPSPLTIAWCKKNRAVIEEMNAKFDKKKSPSHWKRPSDVDYWKTKLAAHKHRAKKLGRKCAWANDAEVERIFRECPVGMSIHHDFPVQAEFISGLDHELNLRYLPLSENCSIGNNFKPRRSIIYRGSITLL
jgi:hypothetical protein